MDVVSEAIVATTVTFADKIRPGHGTGDVLWLWPPPTWCWQAAQQRFRKRFWTKRYHDNQLLAGSGGTRRADDISRNAGKRAGVGWIKPAALTKLAFC